MIEKAKEYRTILIEAVADFDEELMMKYLDILHILFAQIILGTLYSFACLQTVSV